MSQPRAIAIVGLAGRFPGAPDVATLWRNVLANASASRPVPPGRWPVPAADVVARVAGVDQARSDQACLLDEFALDAPELALTADERAGVDPLSRLVLQVGAEAVRSAGLERLPRARTGVILANIELPTDGASRAAQAVLLGPVDEALAGRNLAPPLEPRDALPAALPAARLAQSLGLGGGSFTLDAACASSLYAIALACQELEAGRLDAVVTGGVSLPQSLYTQVGFTQLQALSASGTCSPYDTRADGLVVGEGAGMVVLKRLADARAAGDTILGVVRGVGLSNDVGGSLLSPESEGQVRAMRAAYAEAGWRPGEVQLVEGHGTGTPRGDAVEVESLKALWAGEPEGRCVLGSVKSNVGHLLTAAGATGLAKVLAALGAGQLPPSANSAAASLSPALAGSPFRVLQQAEPWTPPPSGPRRAAVSGFGFGGINAHLLVEEYLPGEPLEARSLELPRLAVVGLATHVGPLSTLERFQHAVLGGKAVADERPAARWSGAGQALPSPRGAWLSSFELPAGRFKVPPRELESLLPQQVLMLKVAAEALADAGLVLKGPQLDTGIVVGLGLDLETTSFHLRWLVRERVRQYERLRGVALATSEREELEQQVRASLAEALDSTRTLGALGGIVPSRVAREFQLGGPSFSVAGEATSGLRALSVAARLLQAGQARTMLVGAVDLLGDVRSVAAQALLRGFSKTGAARPFDERADGPLLGEGAVALVLRRLEDARAEGQRIYAEVAGLGSGTERVATYAAALTEARAAPSTVRLVVSGADGEPTGDRAEAQALAEVFTPRVPIRRFQGPVEVVHFPKRSREEQERARVARAERSLQALATRLAPVEAPRPLPPEPTVLEEVLPLQESDGEQVSNEIPTAFFAGPTSTPPPVPSPVSDEAPEPERAVEPAVALTSTAAVVGHAGAASSLFSVAHAALAVFQEVLPPLAGFTAPLEPETWARGGLHAAQAPQAWLRDRVEGPRRALVTGTGLDGVTVAAVLQSPMREQVLPVAARARPLGERSAALFLVRGRSAPEVVEESRRLAARAATWTGTLEQLAAAWWNEGREAIFDVQRAVVAPDLAELRRLLAQPWEPARRVEGDLGFVFPGSGNHYLGMGRALALAMPEVYRTQDAEVEHLAGQLMPAQFAPWRHSWRDGWEAEAAADLARQPERIILGQVAHGISVADAVRAFGLQPRASVGYSLGESAGLFAFRAWRARDLMFSRTLASPLFKSQLNGECTVIRAAWGDGARWHVVLVNRDAEEVRDTLVGTAALLIVNAPGECVLGGDRPDVEATVAALGCEAIPLEGASIPTVHLPVMAPVAGAYRELHELPCTPPPGVRFYSGAWARQYEPMPAVAAQSIVDNALHGFDFPALVERAWKDGVRAFVELGPQASCTRMLGRILAGRDYLAVSACQRGVDGFRALLTAVGKLAEAGFAVSLDCLYDEDRVPPPRPPPPPGLVVKVGRVRPPVPAWPGTEAASATGSTPAANSASVSMAPVIVQPAPGPDQTSAPASPLTPRSMPALPVAGQGGTPDGAISTATTPRASGDALASWYQTLAATTQAHEAFLAVSQQNLALQAQWLGAMAAGQTAPGAGRLGSGVGGAAAPAPAGAPLPVRPDTSTRDVATRGRAAASTSATTAPRFDRAMCLEFAVGSLAKMLGPTFAEVDTFPTRVRLPAEPLMLVDRITEVQGEMGGLGKGRVVTEHDVLPGAWYLDGGRVPTCISVEAGQADLFLSGYLGIDLRTKGEKVYRLLDAKIVVHRDLPRPGEVLRYDIAIDRFICQGDTWLFFFRFDGTINGQPFITMFDGCAGFFSAEQLASGRGIVDRAERKATPRRLDASTGQPTAAYAPLLPLARCTLDERQVDALRDGDLQTAFGDAFAGRTLAPALRLPRGRMKLVDTITELDPHGGARGLGLVVGEHAVTPDAWYLTCHFIDDQVMPGTLMYECCLHTLRCLLLRLGWVSDDASLDLHTAPVEGVASQLKCRGQVTAQTKRVTYRVELEEVGYDPEPYVIATASMYADGRHVVQMDNMSLKVRGLTRETLEASWRSPSTPAAPRFTREQIVAYAEHNPADCFGEPYRPFHEGRRLARLPRDPFLFVDRVLSVDAPPWKVEPGGWAECAFDVQPDAWYFGANQQRTMPTAVLLEAALQPCGFLAAYAGSALLSPEDLHFRNLDGQATQWREVRPDAGTLTTRARMTKTSFAGGMLLQEFEMEVLAGRERVYTGTTGFGFFSGAALAQQVGVRGATLWTPRGVAERALAPEGAADPLAWRGVAMAPGLTLPGRAWSMLDTVEALEVDGGAKGLGFVQARQTVDAGQWFFRAHFFQDPVMPGSLGVEAFLQAFKLLARERFPALVATHRFECLGLGQRHRWQYRGQVIPTSRVVTVQAQVTRVEDGPEPLLVADGQLAADGKVIYTMKDFSLRLRREDTP